MQIMLTLEKPKAFLTRNFLITINGVVQGVGFRPFVFRAAQKFNLNGYVKNDLEGVSIYFCSSKAVAENFEQYLREQAPKKSKIFKITLKESGFEKFDGFKIIEDGKQGISSLNPTPDFGICRNCTNEISEVNNRRFQYAFTTCTECGPRYSIQSALPFERSHTSMCNFEFCKDCQEEYMQPTNIRFHAQTISCIKCGIKMSIFDNNSNKIDLEQNQILGKIVELLNAQMIVAIKGTGGFLLMADATHDSTIQKLRNRKHRPTKPFAVLIENSEKVKAEATLSENEKHALESSLKPIVILEQLPVSQISKFVNPKLSALGVMLPNSPLLALISQKMGRPLMATSGNISGNPIIFENQKAIEELSTVADFIVINDCDIVMPQDDSVLRFSPKYQLKVVIRRSRGAEIGVKNFDFTPKNVLAMGASIKSTFALKTNFNVYASQYLGDLENFETHQNYKLVLDKFLNFYIQKNSEASIDKIIVDLHPMYYSTEIGKSKAEFLGIPFDAIQHHEAHFAAVLAENDLLNEPSKILGVVWDGTGLGTDGHLWGGEFFVYQNKGIYRVNHFGYFDSILNDKMAKEPRISALSLLYFTKIQTEIIKDKFSEIEYDFFTKSLKHNNLKTCSVGRLFDGMASLLGLIDVQTYEGEAAMMVENLASIFFATHLYNWYESYFDNKPSSNLNMTQILIAGVVNDLANGKEKAYIAAKFHVSLVHLIELIAHENGIHHLTFSGGVFQNTLLVDLLIERLKGRFLLFFHKDLSPNDESISYGQIFHPSIN